MKLVYFMHCWQTGGQHSLIDTFSPYNCWEGGPCYVHEAIDLGALTAGETKTASMNLGATLFAYKGNVCVKRVVVVEEGQHVQISAADVRTFSVGEKVNAMWQGKRQLYRAVHKPTITAQLC